MSDLHRTMDRRTALKERHRKAIVDAAAALMRETEAADFTTDQLAERADVSRRTVFNHFPSTVDIVAEVCADVLGVLVDEYAAVTGGAPVPGDRSAMFEEVATTLRRADLVPAIAYVTRVLSGTDDRPSWISHLLLRALSSLSERLVAAIRLRNPDAGVLDVGFLVNTLIAGLFTLHPHWSEQSGGGDGDHAKQVWSALVERLIVRLREGYADPRAAT